MGTDIALGKAQRRNRLITNTADAISWWGGFHKRNARGEEWAVAGIEADDNLENLEDDAASLFPLLGPGLGLPEPYRRTEPKVGRNEPCPCGSGKKYKKCCGR
jgi:preprotein translocase subunit SecA